MPLSISFTARRIGAIGKTDKYGASRLADDTPENIAHEIRELYRHFEHVSDIKINGRPCYQDGTPRKEDIK